MKCKRCQTNLIRLLDNSGIKEGLKKMGIPYAGNWVCPKCYPDRIPKDLFQMDNGS